MSRRHRLKDRVERALARSMPFRLTVRDSPARNFFGIRFQIATDTKQRLLAAMASLGRPPYKVSDVARAYGARDQRGVSVHRESLIEKGLIWRPRRGQVDLRFRCSPTTCETATHSTRSTNDAAVPG